MISKIKLNDRELQLEQFQETVIDDRRQLIIDFKVTSADYHDVAVLLYEKTFHIAIPEKNETFKASITQYYTSLENLYESGQRADYHVVLLEDKE